jgi:DNA-binding MarR family transcriptional regulator
MPRVSNADYRSLASFRYEIRKFLAFSEQAAREAGIEPQQHQLLLAVRGLPESTRPTIRAVAERLCVQHHTTVALVDKLEDRGLIQRERSKADRREVLLRLTPEGEEMLRSLSAAHRRQLRTVGPALLAALHTVVAEQGKRSPASVRATSAQD